MYPNGYGKADEYFFMLTAEKIAAKLMVRRYKINKAEMNILCAMAAYLQIKGKRIASKRALTDWLGFSYYMEKKSNGFFHGLIEKGMLTRLGYRQHKDGYSVALSPYGIFVLNDFWNEVDKVDKENRGRKKLPGFRSLNIDNDHLPKGYILLDPGRDS